MLYLSEVRFYFIVKISLSITYLTFYFNNTNLKITNDKYILIIDVTIKI